MENLIGLKNLQLLGPSSRGDLGFMIACCMELIAVGVWCIYNNIVLNLRVLQSLEEWREEAWLMRRYTRRSHWAAYKHSWVYQM